MNKEYFWEAYTDTGVVPPSILIVSSVREYMYRVREVKWSINSSTAIITHYRSPTILWMINWPVWQWHILQWVVLHWIMCGWICRLFYVLDLSCRNHPEPCPSVKLITRCLDWPVLLGYWKWLKISQDAVVTGKLLFLWYIEELITFWNILNTKNKSNIPKSWQFCPRDIKKIIRVG